MRHVTRTPQYPAPGDRVGRPRRASLRKAFGPVALVWSVAAGIVALSSSAAVAPDHPSAPPAIHAERVETPEAAFAKADLALLDSNFSLGPAPATLAEWSPLPSRFEPRAAPEADAPQEVAQLDEPLPLPAPTAVSPLVETAQSSQDTVPVPPQRPAEMQDVIPKVFRPTTRQVAQARAAAPAAKTFDDRSFFERFFGGLQQPAGPALGYAAPEDGLFGGQRRLTPDATPSHDQWTAVYDIAAHTVILPNGTRLEAHSGLGDRLDDPRYVHERMRGPTPPHLYDLTPREQLFHGVQALRLNPVGGGQIYGRTGLLAHTFMLGPNGDSNGCVSFRNYNAFLEAYQTGQVRRLMVVARQS